MAKAVTPLEKFRKKFGDLSGVGIAARIGDLAEQFLSEPSHEKEKDKENKEKDKDRKPAAAVKASGAPGPDRE
jgi:hypothetical protein